MRAAIAAVLLFSCIVSISMLAAHSQARSYAWISLGPPSESPAQCSEFSTDINITTWNGAVGALDMNVTYNSSLITITGLSIPGTSPFNSSLFINPAQYSSGGAEITGFQTTENGSWTTPVTIGTIKWRAGRLRADANINLSPRAVVEAGWSPIEVNSYGQNFSVQAGNFSGDANHDYVINIFDLAKVGLCYGCSSAQGCWQNCQNADISENSKIDIFDLATVGLNYGKSC